MCVWRVLWFYFFPKNATVLYLAIAGDQFTPRATTAALSVARYRQTLHYATVLVLTRVHSRGSIKHPTTANVL